MIQFKITLLVALIAVVVPNIALALSSEDFIPIAGIYALSTEYVGNGYRVGFGGEVNPDGTDSDNPEPLPLCDGANLAIITIYKGASMNLVDYYDIESYHPHDCTKSKPAVDLGTDNSETSLEDDTAGLNVIQDAIVKTLDENGWTLEDDYVTWGQADQKDGNEVANEAKTFRSVLNSNLFWGWSAVDFDFYQIVKSSPYGRFLSQTTTGDPVIDDGSGHNVRRPMRVKFERLYDEPCDLTNAHVTDKDSIACTVTTDNGTNELTRTLNELAQDAAGSIAGTFTYTGSAAPTESTGTPIGGCSISGGGSNQMAWALLALPMLVLIRRKFMK